MHEHNPRLPLYMPSSTSSTDRRVDNAQPVASADTTGRIATIYVSPTSLQLPRSSNHASVVMQRQALRTITSSSWRSLAAAGRRHHCHARHLVCGALTFFEPAIDLQHPASLPQPYSYCALISSSSSLPVSYRCVKLCLGSTLPCHSVLLQPSSTACSCSCFSRWHFFYMLSASASLLVSLPLTCYAFVLLSRCKFVCGAVIIFHIALRSSVYITPLHVCFNHGYTFFTDYHLAIPPPLRR